MIGDGPVGKRIWINARNDSNLAVRSMRPGDRDALNRSHVTMLARDALFSSGAVLPFAERFFQPDPLRAGDIMTGSTKRGTREVLTFPRLVDVAIEGDRIFKWPEHTDVENLSRLDGQTTARLVVWALKAVADDTCDSLH